MAGASYGPYTKGKIRMRPQSIGATQRRQKNSLTQPWNPLSPPTLPFCPATKTTPHPNARMSMSTIGFIAHARPQQARARRLKNSEERGRGQRQATPTVSLQRKTMGTQRCTGFGWCSSACSYCSLGGSSGSSAGARDQRRRRSAQPKKQSGTSISSTTSRSGSRNTRGNSRRYET